MAEATSFQFLFGQLRDAETSMAGGTAYFYEIGGTTPKAAYSDIAATSAIYSIVLDADGSAEVYGVGQYRVVVKDSDAVTQYDKDINLAAGSSYVSAPASNTDAYIPQWDGANSGTLKNGLLLATTVGATGADTTLVTEQGIREAITSIVSAATTSSSGTVEIATNAEALAATDASRSISPASLDYVIENTPHVLQVVNSTSGAFASSTTVIPYDDTIPQNTEGTEWLTLAITPIRDDSNLLIEVVVLLHGNDISRHTTIALFQDDTAGALAATCISGGYAYFNVIQPTVLKHFMTSGTTSATTFKVRFGGSTTDTVYINGISSRKFGGVASSSITITEIYNG